MNRFMKLFIKINSKAKNNMNFNSPPWFVSHELLRLGSCLTNHFLDKTQVTRLGSCLTNHFLKDHY
jgi:hypothetical protein